MIKRKTNICYIMRVPSEEYLGYFEYIPVNSKGEQIACEAFSRENAINNAESEGYDNISDWQNSIVKTPKFVI